MEENDDFNDNEIFELIDKFKDAVDSGESRFFDSDDLEIIADELIAHFDFYYANEAVELGLRLYPDYFAFRILKVKKLIMEMNLELAGAELDKIEEEFPPSAELYLEKAFYCKMSGRDDQAMPLLQQAFEMDPESPEINFMLGGEYVKEGNVSKGLELVTYALEQDELMEEQLFTVSYIFEDTRQQAAAVGFFLKLTERFPLSKSAWFALGLAYSWVKEYELAIDAYMNAISLDEEASTAYFNIGNAYFEMRDFDNAVHYYKETLRIDEDDFHAMVGVGDCYLELKQYDEALHWYQQAIVIEPNAVDAVLGCITVLRETGRTDEAEAFIHKSFSLNPQNFELLFSVLPFYQEDEQVEHVKELFSLTINQLENKCDFLGYFTAYCCESAELREMGLDILKDFLDDEEVTFAVPYFIAALHYLDGNLKAGNDFLHNALLINYEGYKRYFFSVNPKLAEIEEAKRLIQLYQPKSEN